MKTKQGIAVDASGQMIGKATMNPEARGIDVRLTIPRSEVKEPIRIIWDTLTPGGFDYHPGVVIT